MSASALAVDAMIARVLRLDVPITVERSIKLVPGGLLGERVLVSFPKAALGEAGLSRLLAFGAELGMPEILAKVIVADFAGAEVVHVGVESERVCKLYLEFSQSTLTRKPSLLFRAAKWDVTQSQSAGLSFYRSTPHLTGAAIADRIGVLCQDRALQVPAGFVLDMLARAVLRNPLVPPFFLEVEDEGTPRRSFDLNFYDSGFSIADVMPVFPQLAQHFGLNLEQARQLQSMPKRAALGHLAAGLARDGREFLTLYYGAGAP